MIVEVKILLKCDKEQEQKIMKNLDSALGPNVKVLKTSWVILDD